MAVGIVDIFGGEVVLDDLVLHHAHAGFLHGHFGKRNAGLVGGDGRGLEDTVHLLLGVGGKLLLGLAHLGQGFLKALHAVHDGVLLCHVALSLFIGYRVTLPEIRGRIPFGSTTF